MRDRVVTRRETITHCKCAVADIENETLSVVTLDLSGHYTRKPEIKRRLAGQYGKLYRVLEVQELTYGHVLYEMPWETYLAHATPVGYIK